MDHWVRKLTMMSQVHHIKYHYSRFILISRNISSTTRCLGEFRDHWVRKLTMSRVHCIRCLISRNISSTTRCVGEFRDHWVRKLTMSGVPEPELSVRYILQHVMDKERELPTFPAEWQLSEKAVSMATQMLLQRSKRIPVQYIIEEWDFRNVTLTMRPPVLIPRPETEQLVGLVLENVRKWKRRSPLRFLDIGCGSGAISLSLLTEDKELVGYAVDISEEAVKLTQENAIRNEVGHRLSVFHSSAKECPKQFNGIQMDFIVSNPPYVSTEEINTLQPEILWYEDTRALDGGPDGLNIISTILGASRHILKKNGHIWLEVAANHCIRGLIEGHPEWHLVHNSTHKDYNGRERFHLLTKTMITRD